MAVFKKNYSDWEIDYGQEVDEELKPQLKFSQDELQAAINSSNLADTIFASILRQRQKAHERLMHNLPLRSVKE